MKPERWQKLDQLFHSALEREPDDRAAFLDEACAGDQQLKREVEALLAAHEQAGSFIESPALKAEAQALADEQAKAQANPITGQVIAHYRIIELLGAGGMGEVYLAQDTSLGRKVALKLLPTLYTRDVDRLRRFEREARTASALNHPNIVTIYEIGETDSTHFIAAEYLNGVTLRAHLANTRMMTNEALDIVVQVLSALAAAHSKGVVHRDIKPENIMVLKESYPLHRENYVKVLDFGIAKLTETTRLDTEAPTKPQIDTHPGIVLGTASYMSPEQARAIEVDARTDIWSLGVVLYEMLSGNLPFKGETAEDVRAAILKDKLPTLPAEIPDRLKWIVEKSLRKDREDRYQTAREFFSDLREVQQQESASQILREQPVTPEARSAWSVKAQASIAQTQTAAVATSPSPIAAPPTSSAEYLVGKLKRQKRGVIMGFAIVLIVGAAVIYGLIQLWRHFQTSSSLAPLQVMKISKLTDSGNATAAAISPDGNYVVYARSEDGKQSLWLRQITPTSEREIVSPAQVFIKGPTFSREGNLVYYATNDGVLYQVPILGGTPRKVLAGVASPISFSPDGRRFAFVRHESSGEVNTDALMVANTDGTEGRELATLGGGAKYFSDNGPAWSPDGKIIACGAGIDPTGIHNTVLGVSVADGTQKPLTTYQGWVGEVARIAWLGDGSGLIVVAAPDVTTGSQIWHVSYPGGEVRRITNDLNDYGTDSLTLTKDSAAFAAVQQDRTSNFWVMPTNEDASRARQITHGKFGAGGAFCWTPDGKIIFPRKTGDTRDFWIIDQDGGNERQLTVDGYWKVFPMFSPDGHYVVFNSARVGVSHIWRMDADGSNAKQLTNGGFEDYSPVFTPDGRWVLFASWRSGSGNLTTWKVPVDGGDPVQLTREFSPWPAVSPDGKLFACYYHVGEQSVPWKLAVYPIEGGQPVKLFDIAPSVKLQTGLSWMSDGRTLIYIDTHSGVSNIWSQSLDGGPPKQLTNFKSDLMFRFALSPDGRQLVLARGTEMHDVVLIRDFR